MPGTKDRRRGPRKGELGRGTCRCTGAVHAPGGAAGSGQQPCRGPPARSGPQRAERAGAGSLCGRLGLTVPLFFQDKLGGALPQLSRSPRVGPGGHRKGRVRLEAALAVGGAWGAATGRSEPTHPPWGALSSEDRFSPEDVARRLCPGRAAVPLARCWVPARPLPLCLASPTVFPWAGLRFCLGPRGGGGETGPPAAAAGAAGQRQGAPEGPWGPGSACTGWAAQSEGETPRGPSGGPDQRRHCMHPSRPGRPCPADPGRPAC